MDQLGGYSTFYQQVRIFKKRIARTAGEGPVLLFALDPQTAKSATAQMADLAINYRGVLSLIGCCGKSRTEPNNKAEILLTVFKALCVDRNRRQRQTAKVIFLSKLSWLGIKDGVKSSVSWERLSRFAAPLCKNKLKHLKILLFIYHCKFRNTILAES